MRKTRLFMVVCVLAGLLAGCTLPADRSVCAPDELGRPGLLSPAMWAVVDAAPPPTLSWTPADPGGAYPYDACHPDGYKLSLTGGLYFESTSYYHTGAGVTHWASAYPLSPGQQYSWSVSATSGDSVGPVAGSFYFFTGPYCATEALIAPVLREPANGSLVDTLQPLLIWRYRDPCLPHGYRVDLSTSSTFADTSLSGGTGNPSTRWVPGRDLTNCTWYYWRIAPINDTTLGPFSITRSFFVDVGGSCLYPLPELHLDPLITPDAVLPIVTLLPIDRPTATPTFLPLLPPLFVLKINSNCRYGPGQAYGVLTSYLVGDSFPPDGRNQAGTWLRLKLNANARCWVSTANGDYNGDLSLLPVIPDPPTPTVTPEPQQNGPVDFDNDGYPSDKDCNDKDAKVHPGAGESTKDNIDSNCNGDPNK